jgi:hypothetical protein
MAPKDAHLEEFMPMLEILSLRVVARAHLGKVPVNVLIGLSCFMEAQIA